MMIPTKNLGKNRPTKQDPWGIQIGRARLAGGSDESFMLASGAGRYDTQKQRGNLWM